MPRPARARRLPGTLKDFELRDLSSERQSMAGRDGAASSRTVRTPAQVEADRLAAQMARDKAAAQVKPRTAEEVAARKASKAPRNPADEVNDGDDSDDFERVDGPKTFDVHFAGTFDRSTHTRWGEMTSMVNGKRTYTTCEVSTAVTFSGRVTEIQRCMYPDEGRPREIPWLGSKSPLFGLVFTRLPTLFYTVRSAFVQLEKGMSGFGPEPERNDLVQVQVGALYALLQGALGIVEVMQEACHFKIALGIANPGLVFERVQSLRRFLAMFFQAHGLRFDRWDEFFHVAAQVCNFRVKQDDVDCDILKLETSLDPPGTPTPPTSDREATPEPFPVPSGGAGGGFASGRGLGVLSSRRSQAGGASALGGQAGGASGTSGATASTAVYVGSGSPFRNNKGLNSRFQDLSLERTVQRDEKSVEDESRFVIDYGKGKKVSVDESLEDHVKTIVAQMLGNKEGTKLPANFSRTTVDLGCAPARYIDKNRLESKFYGNDESGVGLPFDLFWERFYEMYHKFTYESFPRSHRLTALLKNTRGAAEDLVKQYMNSIQPDAYERAVADLVRYFGQTEMSTAAIKAQLRAEKPLGRSKTHVTSYLLRINGLVLRLVNLRETPAQAKMAATDAMYDRMTGTVRGLFSGYYRVTAEQFTSSVREDPEQAYDRICAWISANPGAFAGESADEPATDTADDFAGVSLFTAAVKPVERERPREAERQYVSRSESRPSGSGGHGARVYEDRSTSKGGSRSDGERPSRRDEKESPRKRERDNQRHDYRSPNRKRDAGKTLYNRAKFRCPFHESNDHHANDCPLSPKERNAIVKDFKGCINCLWPGHFRRDCKSRGSCKNCALHGTVGEKHHTSLCFKPKHKEFGRGFARKPSAAPEQENIRPKLERNDTASSSSPAGMVAALTAQGVSAERMAEIVAFIGDGQRKA